MNNKITIWKRYNEKTKTFEHNHIEDGYCPNETPTPNTKEQEQIWKNCIWRSKLGLLIKNKVIPWKID